MALYRDDKMIQALTNKTKRGFSKKTAYRI